MIDVLHRMGWCVITILYLNSCVVYPVDRPAVLTPAEPVTQNQQETHITIYYEYHLYPQSDDGAREPEVIVRRVGCDPITLPQPMTLPTLPSIPADQRGNPTAIIDALATHVEALTDHIDQLERQYQRVYQQHRASCQ